MFIRAKELLNSTDVSTFPAPEWRTFIVWPCRAYNSCTCSMAAVSPVTLCVFMRNTCTVATVGRELVTCVAGGKVEVSSNGGKDKSA